jgi:alcohol dehydrogenase class IV
MKELNRLRYIQPRLRDYGIREASLTMLAGKAVEEGCHLSDPRLCTEVLQLYRQAS